MVLLRGRGMRLRGRGMIDIEGDVVVRKGDD
jgi:hypothetical protein